MSLAVTKAGFVDTDDSNKIKPFQGGTFPGELVITASRTSGVSPCTIMFSAYSTSRVGYDEHQILGTGGTTNTGYYWDFGDNKGETFNTYHGTNKNISDGGWMAAHTFEVADGGGTKAFIVACRAKDASGNEALATIAVTVQAQDSYYSAANTIAVSNTLAATGWDALGEDRVPPNGYTEAATVAAVGSTSGGNVWWDNIQGKRIMLYRGDDFSAEGPIYIRSGNDNFHVTWFGDELSGTTVSATTISFTAPATGPQLPFDAGTSAFVAGETVTGGTSGASGVVRTVQVNTGSWAGNDATGTLDLESETGTFQNNEALTGSGSGAATAAGATVTRNIDKNAGIGGTISDSGSGLGSLTVGAEIDITGSTSNNGTFTVHTVSAGEVKVRYDKGHVLTTEAAGDSVVITEHNLYPELDMVFIGNKDAADTSMFMDDADLAKAVTAFSNDGWCENGYIDGIRSPKIQLGVAYRHIGLHKVDADWSQQGVVNIDAGRLHGGAWVFPVTNGDLDADSCHYPYGLYISECTAVGSRSEISTNDDPTTNIQLAGFGGAWCCVIGTRTRQASEMNLRIEGYQHFLVHDSDFLGQHIGGSGGKGRIVQRGSGINRISEITTANVRGDHHAFDADRKFYPYCRWGLAQYFFDSSSDIGLATFSSIDNPGTVETTLWALQDDVLWTKFTVDSTANVYTADSVQMEVVRWCCITDHTNFNGNPLDGNSSSIVDDGPGNVIINGSVLTQASYLGPTYLDGSGQTAYNLPTATAPR